MTDSNPIPLHVGLLNASPKQTMDDFLGRLGRSGRVYRTNSGTWMLVDVDAAGVPNGVSALPGDMIIARLERNGLIETINGQNGRPATHAEKSAASRFVDCNHADGLTASFLPTIESFVRPPAFKRSGARLVSRPFGFDADDRVFCMGNAGHSGSVDPKYPHLRAVWSGLLFVDPVYHANLIGYTIAAFARTSMVEFPLLLIDSLYKSSGKTAISDALGALFSNGPNIRLALTGDEREVEKKLGAFAGRPGPNVICFDNIRALRGQLHQIRSQLLAIAATAKSFDVRAVYKNPQPIFDPIIVLTMNGARVEADLADRVCRIMVSRPPRVSHRMLDPHPAEYVRAHRGALQDEILDILRRIELTPFQGACLSSRFYAFEQIAAAGAAMLGLQVSFDTARVDSADSIVLELVDLMEAEYTGKEATFTSLVSTIRTNSGLHELNTLLDNMHTPNSALPGRLQVTLLDYTERTFRTNGKAYQLGIVLSTVCNQPVLTLTEVPDEDVHSE